MKTYTQRVYNEGRQITKIDLSLKLPIASSKTETIQQEHKGPNVGWIREGTKIKIWL